VEGETTDIKIEESKASNKGMPETKMDENFIQVVCFKLEDEEYAFDILNIKEVIHLNAITPVPQMPGFVLGVINIRGTIIPVFDLKKKFGLKDKKFTPDTRIIVTILNFNMIGLIVDKVMENTLIDKNQVDPVPSVKMEIDKECIMGIGKLSGRMITLLDIEEVHKAILKDIKSHTGL
jgi:purine-binding chemotaxis protein CheW